MNLLALTLAVALAQSPEQPHVARRFALIVGANNGGGNRQKLRYAVTDAKSVATVMQTLGGVQSQDLSVLDEPNAAGLRAAFAALRDRVAEVRAPNDRIEVLFYYSGHSDEAGLLLQGEPVSYHEVRALLEQVPASVRLAVLDSCASGSLIRSKGGVQRPPFLSDQSTTVTGNAFLTSASDDEAAQESDKLKASFFTHAFVSALRGAGDLNRDRRVTLNEAYQFAFSETLAQTESTLAGPQRPGFDIEMVGRGDLVLTDVRSAGSTLVLPPGTGRVFVHQEEGDSLVAELMAPGSQPIELGLAPGAYRVVVVTGESTKSAVVQLTAGGRVEVQPSDLKRVYRERTALRGGSTYQHVFLNFGLLPPLETNLLVDGPVLNNVQVGFPAAYSTSLEGAGLALAASLVADEMNGVQLATAFNLAGAATGAQLSVGANWVRGDFIGLQAAAGLNKTSRFSGVQLAAGLDLTTDGFVGMQAAPITVAAGASNGAQLGLINIAGDISGTQVGIINIAGHAHGLQLGVLNIAGESDVPVGLLSISGSERVHVNAQFTESFPVEVGLEVGARHVYSVVSIATTFESRPRVAWGAGLGVRIQGESWRVALEGSYHGIYQTGPGFSREESLASLRLKAGYRFTSWLEAYAGPALNTFWGTRSTSKPPGFISGWTLQGGEFPVMLYPGLQAGLTL